MRENEVLKGKCVDINHQGHGVIKIDTFPVFVPNLIYGEEAKIKITKLNKSYAEGKVLEIISESKDRVMPKCKNFYRCGGCDLMHMNYETQLKFKLNMANATLKRIGHIDYNIKKIIGMNDKNEVPYEYRNKIQIPFSNRKGKVVCGFYEKKSHQIIDLDECFIQPKVATDIARLIKNVANDLRITGYDEVSKTGSLRHVVIRKNVNNDYMIILVVNEYDKKLMTELSNRIITRYPIIKSVILNINTKNTNVVLGEEYHKLYGDDILIENILGLNFKLSHKAFFQVNHTQTEKLYSKALEYANITKDDVVLDCYCGVGTISLLAAVKAKKVYGIEVVEEAIKDAFENRDLNKITNAEFIVGKAEEEILKFKDELIDVMIVDPPRKGLDIEVINTIKQKKIKRIVYVSCDVATLSRDLSLLASDYSIDDIILVDMFPQTCHVETVVSLVLRDKTK